MSTQISTAQWAAYEQAINDAHDTFNQQVITWNRSKGGMDRNGEDNLTETFNSITLKALIQYNSFRTWPSNYNTESGALDRETMACLLNLNYLKNNGYINANGNFDYDMAADRFILDGVVYKSMGDTQICQAQDKALIVMVILEREEISTGKSNR